MLRRTDGGFTLIEIMVVITVIAILASLVSPMVFRHVGDAKRATAETQLSLLATALDAYRLDNDHYPSSEAGLSVLVIAPDSTEAHNWRGPYLRGSVPVDPWGYSYQYVRPGVKNPTAFDLWSYGRDGAEGGEGEDEDIDAWR